jgi:hydroxymethylpyrimidine/phosphomethylpyrimidine kinase
MEAAGRALIATGAKAALVKGGHLESATLVDVLLTAKGVRRFSHAKLPRELRGTGCALSAAIVAGLGKGEALEDAVAGAIDFVQRKISTARG